MRFALLHLIPGAIVLLSMCAPLGIMFWIRHQHKCRRNPLTTEMLRAPGESISKRIDDLDDEVELNLTFSCLIPLLCYSSYTTLRLGGIAASPAVFVALVAVLVVLFSLRLYRSIKQRTNERLGLDCERAVGQELNQLMLERYRVYHDFPADDFNIDHVVIGPNGVFAIETKGRAKHDRDRGRAGAVVKYDGQKLQFPLWTEREPIEQAERQAEWLSKWLSSAVGETVAVKPVLALPGWYIERQKPGLLLYNGKNPQFLLKIMPDVPLSEVMVERISHQVDQRCRDVEPRAYQKL